MEEKRNLFDVMQNFIPEDRLLPESCEEVDIERIKTKVFRKKGSDFMKIRILKRTAAAVLALALIAGGAVGVDAATGGHIMKRVKESFKGGKIILEDQNGTTKTYESHGFIIKEQKGKDGDIRITIGNEEKADKQNGEK